MNTSSVLQTIAAEISPYLGQTMARSSVELHCRKLNIEPAAAVVSADQIDALLLKLSSGMNIFIGKDKTVQLIDSIRLKLGTVTA